MKKYSILCIIAFLGLTSCSSDDQDTPSFDVNLLYDQWNFPNVCPDQNNLVFYENGNYVLKYSGNQCNDNRENTRQYTGTFSLNGDFISFNQEMEEIIEQGNNPAPIFQESGVELISQKIIYINDIELFIERRFKNVNTIENRNWLLTREL